jgi:hypothetical protein
MIDPHHMTRENRCARWREAVSTRRSVSMEDDELSDVEALLLQALLSGE